MFVSDRSLCLVNEIKVGWTYCCYVSWKRHNLSNSLYHLLTQAHNALIRWSTCAKVWGLVLL
jgi:hypothetical protein